VGLAVAALLLLGVDRPPGLADVREVRHWSYPKYTRVVVELTAPVQTEVRRLGADPKAERPERLYLDLPNVWVGTRYDEGIPLSDGLLRGIRLGQNRPTATRLVVDLQRYGRHRLFRLTSPHRIVLDVFAESAPRSVVERRAAPTPSNGAPRAKPQAEAVPASLRPIQTVVLDPGHGGEDPGAVGVGGLREKDVTLRVAEELARRLRDRGFRVFQTRERDRSLSLEERTAFAEGVGADVFVSIHANAARRRSAEGIETYYLDKGHQRHSLRVAARENGVPPKELDVLQRALAGLKVAEISVRSAKLAEAIHGSLVSGVRKSHGGVKDLGVKRGPFHVLFLSGMPSVLVETGFVTHPGEARRLRSRYYRDVLAEQMARGLSHYRSARAREIAGKAS
jgi:N-acetylmuramoyl-L-alanine amidase